jgi:hypothetical protein
VALTAPESSSLIAFCNCMKHAKYMVKNNVRFGDENDITYDDG